MGLDWLAFGGPLWSFARLLWDLPIQSSQTADSLRHAKTDSLDHTFPVRFRYNLVCKHYGLLLHLTQCSGLSCVALCHNRSKILHLWFQEKGRERLTDRGKEGIRVEIDVRIEQLRQWIAAKGEQSWIGPDSRRGYRFNRRQKEYI